jgi:hypothetical protein
MRCRTTASLRATADRLAMLMRRLSADWALRDASVDARRKAALGLDMGDPSSLETLTRTHILIMALDAVIDELPPDADVEALVG